MKQEEMIHIRIGVLQRNIDLWVRKEYEVYYREAEKRINEKAAEFAKRWNFSDHQDLLSKLLIEQTVNYIAKEEKLSAYDENLIPRIDRLTNLADEMGQILQQLEDSTTPTQKAQTIDEKVL